MTFNITKAELKEETTQIKIDFDFTEGYNIYKALLELDSNLQSFNTNKIELNNLRPSKVKSHLADILDHLKKAHTLLNTCSESYYSIINSSNIKELTEFTDIRLPNFIFTLEREINSLCPLPGRPRGDMQKFLVCHLLLIYTKGTGKTIMCYWDRNEEKGVGDTFNFIKRIGKLLPQINTELKLTLSDKYICNTAAKAKKSCNDHSKISVYQQN